MAGSWGDVAAFSFYPPKTSVAIGDGGAITTNREDIALKVQRLRNMAGSVILFHRAKWLEFAP